MIQLYKSDNTNYDKNGDMVLMPSSCILKQELNGSNEIELEHPFDKIGRWKYLLNDNVIKIPVPEGRMHRDHTQLYRIYNIVKNDDNITAYARHIFYDLIDKVLINVKPYLETGQEALFHILEGTDFTGYSDIEKVDTADYSLKNVVEAISGTDESFLNKWGGEITLDNFDVRIEKSRGNDNGVRAEFGYNLKEIEEDINIEEVATRLIPTGADGLMISGDTPWVDSTNIDKYKNIKSKVVTFDDIKVKENADDTEGFATQEEAEAEMKARCNKLFELGKDLPKVNYKVQMELLSATTAYEKYRGLEDLTLGDTVTCRHRGLDIDVKARCISLEYNCITEKYVEIELGQFVTSYLDLQNSVNDNLKKKIDDTTKNILWEVSNGDNTLTSKLEITADKIQTNVDNLKNDTHSQFLETAEEIDMKVSKGDDFGTEFKQHSDEFLFLFNGVSTYIQFTSAGIFAKNVNDNSYTMLSSGGICHVDDITGTNPVPYHYWSQVGTMVFTEAFDITDVTIALDAQFKGSQARGIACIKKMSCNGMTSANWVASYISNINTNTLTATISGQANYRDLQTLDQIGGTIEVAYLIIG